MDKQIEEMADIIFNSRYKNDYISPLKGANELYNAGYRKIPENAVVLTEEELFARDGNIHKANREYIKALEECINNRNAKTRKETAAKFAERVKMAFYYEFDELIPSIMADKIDKIAKEITEGEV